MQQFRYAHRFILSYYGIGSLLHHNATIISIGANEVTFDGNGKQFISSNDDDWQGECHFWLAPSTIQGAGLGMYAGKDYQIDDEMHACGDSVISIVDYQQHAAANELSDMKFLWEEYMWDSFGHTDGRYDMGTASPGIGSAANSFLPIYNVDMWHPTKDSAGLHRSVSYGAGGFSYYHNRKATAKRTIRQGQELFVSYGDDWFKVRSHLGAIPLLDDFTTAQQLITKYKRLRNKIGETLSTAVWKEFVAKTPYTDSRVIGSFHHANDEEVRILTNTTTTIKALRIQQSTRTLSWLRQHGICGDHLIVRPSTIPHAGRGAFASRDLPRGTIVSHLPMIHIANRTYLEMFHLTTINMGDKITYHPNRSEGRLGFQLLLNYCYGHANSTLLLCPYGPFTNFINHNQSQANVRLRWSRREFGNHFPELLQQPITSFGEDPTAKLAMELVALRDIHKDEEIFLDYGNEWEEAWEAHVLNWKPVPDAENYQSAADWNANHHLPTVFEQLDGRAQPYPSNVKLKCDISYDDDEDDWKMHERYDTLDHFHEYHLPDYHDCIILRYERAGSRYRYRVHISEVTESEEEERASKQQQQQQHKDNKNPISHHRVGEGGGLDKKQINNRFVNDMPRESLRFFDMPYSDDSFLPNAFRHDIRIPNDLFPPAWMNQ